MSRYGLNIRPACCRRFVHLDLDHRPDQAEIERLQAGPCAFCVTAGRSLTLDMGINEPDEVPAAPRLHGSPAQVSWALEVRSRQLRAVNLHLIQWRRLIDAHRDPDRQARGRINLRTALDAAQRLEDELDAHWWIEHRDDEPAELLKAAQP